MPASRCIVLLILLLSGCVAAPVQEMSNARQAIAVAERSAADHPSGAQTLAAARAALADAEVSLRHRQFRAARDQALQARQLALTAQSAAQDTAQEDASPDAKQDAPQDATQGNEPVHP